MDREGRDHIHQLPICSFLATRGQEIRTVLYLILPSSPHSSSDFVPISTIVLYPSTVAITSNWNCMMNSDVVEESTGTDDGLFDCNICLELAQHPIVTLCGHLFCWPCLYRWLRVNVIDYSHHCPVCKAIMEENKLVPVNGRGKIATDGVRRSRSSTPVEDVIPHRPTGHRNQAHNQHNHLHDHLRDEIEHMTGEFLSPLMSSARWTNFVIAAGIVGLFPSLFSFPFHGVPNAGSPYSYSDQTQIGGLVHGIPFDHGHRRRQVNPYLKRVFVVVGALLVFLCLKWMKTSTRLDVLAV